MTRFHQHAAAAVAAVAIMLATFVPVLTVPPVAAQAIVVAPVVA